MAWTVACSAPLALSAAQAEHRRRNAQVAIAAVRMSLDRIGEMHIVLAGDSRYAMQLATTMRSAVEANRSGRTLTFYVLCDDISPQLRERVHRSLPGPTSVRWVPVTASQFGHLATANHISPMTFARLTIPDGLPPDIRRVLYLHADLLVLDDLGSLWNFPMEDAPVAAVLDSLDPLIHRNDHSMAGVPRVERYFNAGVLLIDIPRWKSCGVADRALTYLAMNPASPFSDQDALNVACDGQWATLPARWNFHNHFETAIEDLPPNARPGIVHFVTGVKPWRPASCSVNASFYGSFRDRTLFARTRFEKLCDVPKNCWYRLKRSLLRPAWRVAVRHWGAARQS